MARTPVDYTGNDINQPADTGGGTPLFDPSSPYYTPPGEVTKTFDQSQILAVNFLPPNSRFRPVDPKQPLNVPGKWVDTQTGQVIFGMQASNDRSKIVTGFTGPNPQNTTSYDAVTGEQHQADPHQWLDALKNTAMIWGGPETAGVLTGAFGGGAGAASAASGGAGATGGGVAPVAATAGAGGVAGGTAAGTGAATAFGVRDALGLGGAVAAGIEQQRLAAKQAEAQQAAFQNNQAIEIARQKALSDAAQVNQQLAQKQVQQVDYQRNLRNAIQAGLLDPTSGVQDINFNLPDRISSHMGTVTGGLRPSAFGNRGAISAAVGPQALEALQHNPTTTDLLPPAGSVSPNLAPWPTTSGADSALGYGALGLGALSYLWPKPTPPTYNTTPTPYNLYGAASGAGGDVSQVGTNPLYTVNPAFSGINFYGRR